MFYRFFRGRVNEYVITMEQEALKLVEVMCGMRAREVQEQEHVHEHGHDPVSEHQ